MTQVSPKTILNSRTLWYDGDSTVSPCDVETYVTSGITQGLFVTEMTKDIQRYNKLVPNNEKIEVKNSIKPLDYTWNIPEHIKKINLHEYVLNRLYDEQTEFAYTDAEFRHRLKRALVELKIYKHLEMYDILYALIHIINTFQANNTIWGIGRGSSVASFVLYLIGVHDVDSVKYDLNITDFLR